MDIRPLSPSTDLALAADLFSRAADYVMLEDGVPPDDRRVIDFFEDRPPKVGTDSAAHFGLFEGTRIIGLLGMVFGYPEVTDAYIGLLLIDPAMRGKGLGVKALAHAEQVAKDRNAERLLIAVLDANPKGRAFWEREGFVWERTFKLSGDAHTRYRMTRAIQ